jgi:hypothetical protein
MLFNGKDILTIRGMKPYRRILYSIFFLNFISCDKLVDIPAPINSITASQVFSNDNEASAAVAAIYSYMSLGGQYSNLVFSNGGMTIYAGLSSDELSDFYPGSDQFLTNTLISGNTTPYTVFWQPAYFDIYMANAVISNLQGSTAVSVSTRNQLIGEAEFLRALCYFYLTNLYGDVPLVLSTDFHETALMARTPQSQVYNQIILDLHDAQNFLVSDFSYSNGEHTRANKWAAIALLARVYLYNQNWNGADSAATAVINSGIFSLLSTDSLNQVFLANSNESILQFQTLDIRPWATAEGNSIAPSNPQGNPGYILQNDLVASFEPGDQRFSAWVGVELGNTTHYYPFKYKVRQGSTGNITEYYTVLRFAEQYLIRAEAEAKTGGASAAIADLNVIRSRAGLASLSDSATNVMDLVVQERRIELFAEWGHRWLDLKRWGTAVSTLDTIPSKGYNINTDQLLYPIPLSEIQSDPNLKQNPGYSSH